MAKKITPLNSQPNFPNIEGEISKFWQENNIFQKSVNKGSDSKTFSFIDGPPFVSGIPHYGHFITSIAKDIIPRYQTMKGNKVRRVWGWDCHGLPIEDKVNQQYGITSNSQVEKEIGVKQYVQSCRKYVEGTINDWRWYIEKIGRWVDMDHPYRTMDLNYMESVLWAFRTLYDKQLVYRDKRVSLYSTDTQTPVSNFEVAMDPDNYRDVEDRAIFVKFFLTPTSQTKFSSALSAHLDPSKPAALVAWTTTTWTIPANVALAVHAEADYVIIEKEGEYLIVAKPRMDYTFGENSENEVITEFKGTALIGLSYQPIFDFFKETATDHDYNIIGYNGVTMDEGTGILHVAPAYGEEDYDLGKINHLSTLYDINREGKLTVGSFAGIYIREATEPILAEIEGKGNLLRSEQYIHRLPFYRGENPLIYMVQDAYFVDIQSIKTRMLELNEEITWIPEHLKHGRFAETVATSPDWCISRNRYWATIIPIWRAEDGSEIVIGSLAELAELCPEITTKSEEGRTTYWLGDKLVDLHRDVADDIVLVKDGLQYHRIPEVLDCWMDSGSVPFAEHHYPFENKDEFEKSFPADYIIEYTPQVRAWFSMLLRLSTVLFDKPAFTNVVCHGTLLGSDGRKMSKSYGNYPNAREVLENIGGEAVRLYLMNTPIMVGDDASWSDNELREGVKNVLIPFYNIVSYFSIYADLHDFAPENADFQSDDILDIWLKNYLYQANKTYQTALNNYNFPESVKVIQPTIDALSSWWIRRSRGRIVAGDTNALQTLYSAIVFLCRTFAPQMSFITEYFYQHLVSGVLSNAMESVHLEKYPEYGEIDEKLLQDMAFTRDICSLGQFIRKENAIKLRQPLSSASVGGVKALDDKLLAIIKAELNVKDISLAGVEAAENIKTHTEGSVTVGLDVILTEELKEEGLLAELIRQIQTVRKSSGLKIGQYAPLSLSTADDAIIKLTQKHEDQIKKTVFASEIKLENATDGTEITVDSISLIIKFE